MAIISKARLTALTENRLGTRMFSEALNEAKRENKAYVTSTMFLSHSHDDLDIPYVQQAIVFLRKCGVRIYIDSEDPSLPPFTDGTTANKIKEEIKQNRKFVLLATINAINSRWCNWELGIGDTHKYIDHICLFPLSENSGAWNGNEYLRIYPRIEESNYGTENFKVIYPNRTEISISDWLRK